MRNVSDKKLLKKNQHTFCVPVKFFWKSCCLWDNIEKCCRARDVHCLSCVGSQNIYALHEGCT